MINKKVKMDVDYIYFKRWQMLWKKKNEGRVRGSGLLGSLIEVLFEQIINKTEFDALSSNS